MISFKKFLSERLVDPVELAHRVARRYGKKSYYGPYLKATKHENIPLKSYDRKNVSSLENKYFNYHKKIGLLSREKHERVSAKKTQDSHTTKKSISIKDLHATQPFNRTEDSSTLKSKIDNKSPDHIHVITHKGKHYVSDGHHAVMAAHLRGDKNVTVNHLDLDKVSK